MALAIPRSSVTSLSGLFVSARVASLLPSIQPSLSRFFPWSSQPSSADTHATGEIRQSFLGSLLELFPPFLLAVPKKKVSHSRKSMRAANKGLKDKQNIVNCPACGSAKLAHHLCANCYTFLNRQWKQSTKGREIVPDLS
ncbi:hypothetical protein BDV98DRAFT_535947 [Pterulicium gracile]|uniref:Large ribosomal subunit protein bL32m n=1 Tax=Pterulicium gracile TaxID=1884261 RepID=A0A5C3Q4I7_9AGAR|nr:hypothetical protein BDV98DRAFT_535947 [Pterula gracilis]